MDGKITISRTTHSKEGDSIRIRVQDNLSGVSFIEVQMTLENFALALTGLGYVDCGFELFRPDLVGKIEQNKTEFVPLRDTFWATDEERQEALRAFEVDGWKARNGDIKNSHNYTKDGKVKVVFFRHVEA